MTRLITAPLSSKGQMTVPKAVRKALNLTAAGDTVGFLVDEKTRRVVLTKMQMVPAEASFSHAEIQKLLKLSKEPGGKSFSSARALLSNLKKK